tara:strand:+ start:258 stop:1235 length:978 start_codon:yes stop_codon:yes gene_type:complete
MHERYNSAVEWLENKSLKLISTQKIYKGINSNVWKIEGKDFCYALKLYKIDNKNNNRYNREVSFISHLNKYKLNCVPKLIEKDKLNNWVLYDWIKGDKIKSIDQNSIHKIINFIVDLKGIAKETRPEYIPNASDYCLSGNDFKKNIDTRLNLMEKRSKENINVKEFYDQVIVKDINDYRENFQKELLSKSINDFISRCGKTLSQSDMGIHNIIKKPDGMFCFIDFEHSGWDSVIKTIADLILQPENILNRELSQILINESCHYFNLDNYKSDNWKIILETQRIKWALIMLNPILKNKSHIKSEYYEELKRNVKNYLKKTKETIYK